VIPGQLFWLPGDEVAPSDFTGGFALAASLCSPGSSKDPGPARGKVGRYAVPHYKARLYGRAFGPLALDQILCFCRGLETQLALTPKFAVGSRTDDLAARTNAAVLLGAYLVLRLGWRVRRVEAAMGAQDARATFPCSWSSKPRGKLQVRDCWAGLEQAVKHGWLDSSCLQSDEATAQVCTTYRHMVDCYDTSWLVPRVIMVAGEPEETAADPNPETFIDVLTPLEPKDTFTSNSAKASMQVVPKKPEEGTVLSLASPASVRSCDSVFKEFDSDFDYEKAACPLEMKSFASYLEGQGVGFMVRANFCQEVGMVRSYHHSIFVDRGMQHLDLPVSDYHGSLPTASDVSKFIAFCKGPAHEGREGVLVHCKAGFGRSVTLACCLVVERFSIPGRALLGWVRMARPGAVNTIEQERFIIGLSHAKVTRRLRGPGRSCSTFCNLL